MKPQSVFRRFCDIVSLLALVLSAGIGTTHSGRAAEVYTNPVIGLPVRAADPFVLKWNGEYYLYTTGNPITAYHSTDLVDWTEVGPVLHGSDEADAWNQTNIWAPEVTYRNGKFYMTYTATRASRDWRVEEMARRIGVAVSDSPRGPFEDIGAPLTREWGIDSHVFRDPDDGSEYLFYSYLYEPEHPGAGLVVDAMPSPTEVAGAPSHVTRGSEAWEDKTGNPRDGNLRYTNEAPTVLKRDGRYYMMYSGGSWDLPTYSLAYAVSDRVRQGGLDGPGWEKVSPPLLRSTSLVEGPGHNSVTPAPNNVDDITAYHARVVPFRGPGDREVFIDRIYWTRNGPHLRPPALGARAAPDRAVFGDIFDREDGSLGDRWEVNSGSWEVVGGHARGSGFAAPRSAPLKHYVFEANLRFPNGASAPAGVRAFYADGENRVDVTLDPGERVLRTSGVLRGEAISEQVTPLESGFRFDAYHRLLVTKNADRFRIALDGVRVQEFRFEAGPGRVGLIADGDRADFDGIALTPHYLDHFTEPDSSWTSRGGAWLIEKGAIHQVAGGGEIHAALKGDPAENYEFTANVRTRENDSTGATTGVVAADDGRGNRIVAGFDHDIWPFARFRVRWLEDGEVRRALQVGLPRGFLYEEFHAIRVIKRGRDFTFYLDEARIVDVRFPVGSATPGLYTEGVRAAFDDVSMKHTVVPGNLLLNGDFLAETWDDRGDAPPMPWRLSGAAEINLCCGHTGNRRLLLTGADGRAVQEVGLLEPGRYRLYAWATTVDTEAEISIGTPAGEIESASVAGEAWKKLEIEFAVGEDDGEVRVQARGRFGNGAEGHAAFDDFFLVRTAD